MGLRVRVRVRVRARVRVRVRARVRVRVRARASVRMRVRIKVRVRAGEKMWGVGRVKMRDERWGKQDGVCQACHDKYDCLVCYSSTYPSHRVYLRK